MAEIELHAKLGTRRPRLRHPFRRMGKLHACAPGFSFYQHDTGVINFGAPQFVKHLIENYG